MVLDEHDVVHGLLDLEGHSCLVGVDLRRRLDDGGEAAVEPVEVPLQLPLRRRGVLPSVLPLVLLSCEKWGMKGSSGGSDRTLGDGRKFDSSTGWDVF